MNFNVVAAIFRRNFVSYFANPTGYVFICVFVLLGSFAAFWPDEFFNTNLANLDQLNKWFPYIMLVFVPAITMSIWADERRQGTDELLLTIPATDLDVVLGKYFSGVAIYTVSLLFSFICNLIVLRFLGQPDVGLFLGVYFGYWMVGLAMIAVGMVASFLTGNLTVAFILGVLFNAPLVFLNVVDSVVRGSAWTATAKGWSIGEQMSDFGRGVISLSSIAYFLLIAVVMLYLCMVLIGRRHWMGGKGGRRLGPHYLFRAIALVLMAAGITLLVQNNFNVRADVTQERLNSVSPETLKMIRSLDPKHPVVIDAYVSGQVPEEYVQTRLDLLNLLREFEKLAPGKIQAKIYDNVEPLTDVAQRAEQQFGIVPQEVFTQSRGIWKQEQFFLGAAITSGLEKIVIPFFERGIPVEYELARSIATITQEKRRRLGVVTTDVELFGGIDMASFRQRPRELLIEELEKQYDVVRVDPSSPIVEKYDVLLAVQPSSLTAVQLKNLIAAIREGQPTAIFEDPLPFLPAFRNVPGTGDPRQPPQGMGMMRQPPREPKGDINQLWDLLGVEFIEKTRRGSFGETTTDLAIVWQQFKPPALAGYTEITPQWLFIQRDAPGAEECFNAASPVTSGLQELLFLQSGGLLKRNAATTDYLPLVTTGDATGTIMVRDVRESLSSPFGANAREGAPTGEHYTLAAHITGSPRKDDLFGDAGKHKDAEKDSDAAKGENKAGAANSEDEKKSTTKPGEINVILVADIDLIGSEFFGLRARRNPDSDVTLTPDNVTFVLNAVDVLAGEERFLEVRNRRPWHRALEAIVKQTEEARKAKEDAVHEFRREWEQREAELERDYKEAEDKLKAEIAKLQNEGTLDFGVLQQKATEMSSQLAIKRQKKDAEIEEKRRKAKKNQDAEDIKLNNTIRSVQDRYKLGSVLLPPILPLVVAFFVYFSRRSREREGVSKARLR